MDYQNISEVVDQAQKHDKPVFMEQIRLLQEQSRTAVLLNLPLILISTVIFWNHVPHRWLLPWALGLAILSLLRLSLFRQFRRMEQSEDCVRRWAAIHLLITALTGASWGGMGFFLFQGLSAFQSNYIILVFLGLTGTAISVNASYLRNFLAFILPASLVMEIVLFSLHTDIYSGFSYLLLIYLLVLIKAAHTTERNIRHAIILRQQNQALVDDLRHANAGLTQEIQLRSSIEAQLREAKELAEQASRSKSEFISRISHELRTPLTAILGFSGILSHSQKVEESVRTDIAKINKAGQHLLSLLDDLLDITRIESGKLSVRLEQVKLDDLLEETRGLIAPMAEKFGINMDIAIPQQNMILNADYMRLKQVLLNLLSNAVKYNRSGGSVSLSVEPINDERVRINVVDTGVGIAADKLDDIFQPYNRLGAENTSIVGTGIGMTISKQIIDLMHGEIGVDSEVGKGSHFWVELPLTPEWEISGIQDTDFLVDGLYEILPEGFLCLYVEDNPTNVALIRRMMEHMGNIRLISAPTAELGIELATAHNPDLILMDINLPGMDGYKALEILRRNDAGAQLPIIAISANSAPGEVERGLAAGFDDYLTKPVDMETLAASIARSYQSRLKSRANPSA